MTLLWLLSWWNLIFAAPFGLALVYLGLYTLTGITLGEPDVDHDFDVDADADFDHDVQIDHDLHADAEMDHDVDHDAAAEHDLGDHPAPGEGRIGEAAIGGSAAGALQWLGIGRVPLSILLMVMLLAWGWIGVIVNLLLRPHVARPWHVAEISVPAALVGSVLLMHAMSSAISRWFPLCETTARRRHELLGSVGEAVYAIDQRFGMVIVRDEGGDLYQLPCRAAEGQPPIDKGERVKLTAYSARQGIFTGIVWERKK